MAIPPGRPETLTPEQEAKLKEFWTATLQVFGVGPASTAAATNGSPADATPASTSVSTTPASATSSETPTPSESGASTPKEKERPKKATGLGRFLTRGKKEKTSNSETNSGTSTPTNAASQSTLTVDSPPSVVSTGSDAVASALSAKEDSKEDKYGQTKAFKTALADLSPEELRTAFWDMVKHDNPDGLLLRFLRARKWDVEKALVMMVSTMHWRLKEMNVEELMRAGELSAFKDGKADDFLQQVRLGKSYLHNTDKEGRPICYVRVRLHKAGDQTEESLERYTVYIMETARLMLVPPVDTAAVVFDMTNFSMANMDYPPVRYLIKCFEAHYPESLGVCLVHKAPWIFQGIWSIIKGWLDPVVASKIHFTKSAEDLAEFIDKKNIPKELGGEEEWEYVAPDPVQGENDAQKDTETLEKLRKERKKIVEEYEELTKAWILEKPEVVETKTEGSATHTPATTSTTTNDTSYEPKTRLTPTLQSRNSLAEKLATGYWQMDKYVRAKTIYDRLGYIKEGGVIDYLAHRNQKKVTDVVVPVESAEKAAVKDQPPAIKGADAEVD